MIDVYQANTDICFNYGILNGCDENCPSFKDGTCEICKNDSDILKEMCKNIKDIEEREYIYEIYGIEESDNNDTNNI